MSRLGRARPQRQILTRQAVAAPGAISAALPIVFNVAADLKAQGKLDAALATVYTVTADLKAQGKLDISTDQDMTSAYFVYMRKRSTAKIAASSPPVPARISR